MNKEKHDMIDDLLDGADIDVDTDDIDKIASSEDGTYVTIKEASSDELKKIAAMKYELGRFQGKGIMAGIREETAEHLASLGLTPERVQESIEKEAAASGLSSSPRSDMMSETINFIMKKIHPIMMMNNYRPGSAGDKSSNNINPDKHPMGKEDAVVADHRRTDKVTDPISVFGLNGKNK